MSTDTVRWVLSNGLREVACIMRPLELGCELGIIYYDGLPLGTHICQDEVDALRWSDELRAKWEAQGYTAAA